MEQISKRRVVVLGVFCALWFAFVVTVLIVEDEGKSWFGWLIWGGMIFSNLMLFGVVYRQYKKQKNVLNKGE